jgi:membrane-associated PAP2 superfamily phosphatase
MAGQGVEAGLKWLLSRQFAHCGPMPFRLPYRSWLLTFCLLIPLLVWDAAGLDLPLARLAAGARGFALRDHWLLTSVLHDAGRYLAWLVVAWLLIGCWHPSGILRRLPLAARVQWLATALLCLLAINLLKYSSLTSCPWDLSEFGGAGVHLSHWVWGSSDGGPGHCFPAGHAVSGFAFMGGYFAARDVSQRLAWQLLLAAAGAGLVLGIGQQLRGAHFMSHTLWTGWICWALALGVQTLVAALGAPAPAPLAATAN